MKKLILSIGLIALLCGCVPEAKENKDIQSEKARVAANSLNFTENSEIENITNRLKLTSNPGQIGFVVLLNGTGQPISYGSVKGKITSSGKRLTPPVKFWRSIFDNTIILGDAPSDEGTWGSSDPYVYWWDTNGQYHQWNGEYLYSDKPFRLKIEPLVIQDN